MSLHAMLVFSHARSLLEAVMATYDQKGCEVIAICAARILLDEAACVAWRFSAPPGGFEARATR
ncbi:hypothetical protein AB0H36_11610 [Kribbella sp. NPDC050820]|uniref:hypothetical protein n=1 Tax=Kribbella sp. NPDC050820 TaxID=3155408 RepID=UPI0033CA5602